MKNLAPFILFITIAFTAFSQQPQKRIALVIGAQNYTVLPKLRNSLSDAKSITATLQAKGFQVKPLYDPKTRAEIKDGINWYYNQMQDQVGAVGLIFYAGHGMQYHGDNYIIPTAASLQNPGDLEDYCVKMNIVMEILNSTSKSLNILLLDACRSLPSFTRGSDQGLSKMSPPEGSIIVFATTAGKVADDGTGTHGLFTSKLLLALNEPGLNVNDVFRKVQRDVYAESHKQQLPELDDLAVGGDFYFTNGESSNKVKPVSQPLSKSEGVNHDIPSTNAPLDYGYGPDDAPTVVVGSQVWISHNLNVSSFANGDIIPEAKTSEEWIRAGEQKKPAWCYYDNQPANGRMYGKLYNWYAVHDLRGLAPKGWHIPSGIEWTSIIDYLGGKSVAGTSLKSTFGWQENRNGNNRSGIEAFPGGGRLRGSFNFLGEIGYWWTSSEDSTDVASACSLGLNGNVIRGGAKMAVGLSVRCIKDTFVTPNNSIVPKLESTVEKKTTSRPFDYGYGPSDATTVAVGSQVWISKNLNVDHFANGDPIPEAETDEEWKAASDNKRPAWCYNNKDPFNGSLYGRLYNWYAVHDPRSLAPKGWHVPADAEWDIIIGHLAGKSTELNKPLTTSSNVTFYVTDLVGTMLKSTSGWENKNGVSGNGNNSSGFAALPGGYRSNLGNFLPIGGYGCWWSSTEYDSYSAWYRDLNNGTSVVGKMHTRSKYCGMSVRCVKD